MCRIPLPSTSGDQGGFSLPCPRVTRTSASIRRSDGGPPSLAIARLIPRNRFGHKQALPVGVPLRPQGPPALEEQAQIRLIILEQAGVEQHAGSCPLLPFLNRQRCRQPFVAKMVRGKPVPLRIHANQVQEGNLILALWARLPDRHGQPLRQVVPHHLLRGGRAEGGDQETS